MSATATRPPEDRLLDVPTRGPRPGAVLRLAAGGGRSDRVRIALTALGAAAAVLSLCCAAAVAAIGPGDGPYTSDLLDQPGLHPGVVAAFVLLCVPVLACTGQCARIGAPARDRRLATLRLIGATPADVRRIAGAETALAAALGSIVGLGAFFAGRVLLGGTVVATHRVTTDFRTADGGYGRTVEDVTGPVLRLPTDALPPWWLLALLVVAVPLGAGIAGQLALRRVAVTPFGLVRDAAVRPVRVLPLVAFAVGTAGMALSSTLLELLDPPQGASSALALVFLVLFLLAVAGLVSGTAALASVIGGWAAPRARRPALLIAARRLVASPHDASRANAAVLVVVVIAAGVQGFRANVLTSRDAADGAFYDSAIDLVLLALLVGGVVAALGLLVAATEGVLTRRRTLALLVAAGTPRGVLHRAVLLEVLLPLAPAVLLATACGALAARGVFGTTVQTGSSYDATARVQVPAQVVDVPVPWAGLGLVAATALGVTALFALAVLPLLTRAVDATELRAG